MFTRCPECHTAFRVTAGQLQQAAGRVRCGHCAAAFNALRHLSEAHPSGEFPALASHDIDASGSANRASTEPSAIEVAEDEQDSQEIILETGSHDLDEFQDLTGDDTPTRDDLAALTDHARADPATAGDDDDYVPEIEDTGVEWVVLDDETGSHWAQGRRASDASSALAEKSDARVAEDLEDTLSREASALLGDDPSLTSGSFWTQPSTPEAPDPLSDTASHFWQPPAEPDDWLTDDDASANDPENDGDGIPMLLLSDPAVQHTPEAEKAPETGAELSPTTAPAPEDAFHFTEDFYISDDAGPVEEVVLSAEHFLPEELDRFEKLDLLDAPELSDGIELSDELELPEEFDLPEDVDLSADVDVSEGLDVSKALDRPDEPDRQEALDPPGEIRLFEAVDLTAATTPAITAVPTPLPKASPPPSTPSTPAVPSTPAARAKHRQPPSRPPSIDSLERGEKSVTSRRGLSVAIAVVLVAGVLAQSVHHFRESLAIDPRSGPAVIWLYEMLGRPLYPAWPLQDYQLRADEDALMAADRQLQIRATLTNRGARALPPPLIRLTLLDRWGESLGSRMLQPTEYLAAQSQSRLAPGAQLAATLSVRAPPGELYGYRLDVCHRLDGDNVRCDAQSR